MELRPNLTQCAISHNSKDKKKKKGPICTCFRDQPLSSARDSEGSLLHFGGLLAPSGDGPLKGIEIFKRNQHSEDARKPVLEDGFRGLSVYPAEKVAKNGFTSH
jgi:hypothetical protein